jgi:hypothetical protein
MSDSDSFIGQIQHSITTVMIVDEVLAWRLLRRTIDERYGTVCHDELLSSSPQIIHSIDDS